MLLSVFHKFGISRMKLSGVVTFLRCDFSLPAEPTMKQNRIFSSVRILGKYPMKKVLI